MKLDSFIYFDQQQDIAFAILMPPMNSTYDEGIAISVIVINALSFLSLSFVIIIYIVNWKSIASFPMRLSFYLCLACLGQSLLALILNPILLQQLESNNPQTSSLCIFDAILKVSLDLSSIIWTTLIIYSVYASVAMKTKLQQYEVMYLFIGFIAPTGLACIPIGFEGFNYDIYYCWFVNDNTAMGFWLRFGYFFLPLWGLFITNMILAFLTYVQLKKIQLSKDLLKVFTRIALFPLILFITGIFATADAVNTYSTKNETNWLNDVGIIMVNLYGLLTSIAYGLNPLIRQKIRLCFSRKKSESFTSDMPDFRSSGFSDQIKEQLMQMTQLAKVSSHVQRQVAIQQKIQTNKKRNTNF